MHYFACKYEPIDERAALTDDGSVCSAAVFTSGIRALGVKRLCHGLKSFSFRLLESFRAAVSVVKSPSGFYFSENWILKPREPTVTTHERHKLARGEPNSVGEEN